MSVRQCKSNNTFKDENFGKKWRIITFEFTVNNLAESSMMLESELVCLGKKFIFFFFRSHLNSIKVCLGIHQCSGGWTVEQEKKLN